MTETDAKRLADHMRRRAAWIERQICCDNQYAKLAKTWAADLRTFADEIHQEEK